MACGLARHLRASCVHRGRSARQDARVPYRTALRPSQCRGEAARIAYQSRNRPPSRDESEIEATKAAYNLSLPVFVITKPFPDATTRNVSLGWIEEWDDERQVFRISFVPEEPTVLLAQPEEEAPFTPQEEALGSTTVTKTRPSQQRFSFRVFQRYGEKCTVCDLDLPELLDAAHLIPKKDNGTDDPRNGIVLCALHHRALDAGLFCFDPDTLRLCYRENGPDAAALRITRADLHHLRKLPHPVALNWLMGNWDA